MPSKAASRASPTCLASDPIYSTGGLVVERLSVEVAGGDVKFGQMEQPTVTMTLVFAPAAPFEDEDSS